MTSKFRVSIRYLSSCGNPHGPKPKASIWCATTTNLQGKIDEEYNFAVGTLFTIVNAIPDYRGTRSSISKWLRRMTGALIPGSGCRTTKAISSPATPAQTTKKKGMTKKTSPSARLTDTEQTILDLTRKLNAAIRKIEKLEADRKKAELREEFQSGVIAEYKKLVKPAQSKKSTTK